MNDGIYRTRSLGVAAQGLPDQYADGKAATVWSYYVGSTQERTAFYRDSVCSLLREHGVKHVLDVACGTGVDSVMLLENGFKVTSIDASDKMLKYAHKTRWQRRKEAAFDNWAIEEGNWLTLLDADVDFPEEGFDALICLGNSFAHLPDFNGDQSGQRTAIDNFCRALKPGGVLLIDHRNYDAIIDTGRVPEGRNIYYHSKYVDEIKTSVLYVDSRPQMITLDYHLKVPTVKRRRVQGRMQTDAETGDEEMISSKFRLSYHPHRLESFKKLLAESFGHELGEHTVYGDFEKLPIDRVPAYFIHAVVKKAQQST